MASFESRLGALERAAERVMCPSCGGRRIEYRIVGPFDACPPAEACPGCGRDAELVRVINPFHPDMGTSRGPGRRDATIR